MLVEKIKSWIIKGIDKMFSKETIEQALKVNCAVSNEMESAMKLWLEIYLNKARWLNGEVKSLQLRS